MVQYFSEEHRMSSVDLLECIPSEMVWQRRHSLAAVVVADSFVGGHRD